MDQQLDVQDVPRWQSSPSQSLGHVQNWRRVKGAEYLAREQARVDARKQEQPSSSSQKRAVSEEWDRPPEKFWRKGEEDVTMKQDITATSGASSSSASRGPAMDTESRPSRKRAADVQTED